MDYLSDLTVQRLAKAEPMMWSNPKLTAAKAALAKLELGVKDVDDAAARLARFAPYIRRRFPETAESGGLIESPLTEIPAMLWRIRHEYSAPVEGRLFIKRDSDLPISGSIKARGGIYEVLKHAETLAKDAGMLDEGDDYAKLCNDEFRSFFSKYSVQVASTGNLGLSIGVMSAALGFKATVHMSADAREWKKRLLRSRGVSVIEYPDDYSAAVINGRKASELDPMSYFVDDENSHDLFLGYSAAAGRLKAQLDEEGVEVNAGHPLFVYIPCGVGGGPGGVTFGLKLIYGDDVHVFFVEPVNAPCMALGMATGLNSKICVQDIGLNGKTEADGLAVGRASGFVGNVMEGLLSGEFTVEDGRLYDYMRSLIQSQELFAEPSACAAFEGPVGLYTHKEGLEYMQKHALEGRMKHATHIVWATGGSLVPEHEREKYAATYIK